MPDAEGKGDAREERLSGPQRLRVRDRNFVLKQMNAEALEKCSETRAAYVECATGGCTPRELPVSGPDFTRFEFALAGRTLSISWACRGFFNEFNECLKQ